MNKCNKCDGSGRARVFGRNALGKCAPCGGAGVLPMKAAPVRQPTAADIATHAATHRVEYAGQFVRARQARPDMTTMTFRELTRPIAEDLRSKERCADIQPEHWSRAARYVAADLTAYAGHAK